MDLEDGTISATEFRDEVRKHISEAITDQQIDEAFNPVFLWDTGTKTDIITSTA